MGKQHNILKHLRAIALEHATANTPDLALMARDLGRVVHQESSLLADRLTPLHTAQRGFAGWLLARRRQPSITVLVLTWPPNHRTPLHDHAGIWGLDMALHGAFDVQSYVRDPISGELGVPSHHWLGPGDSSWFDAEQQRARRCRNLSRHETALTLHVYGGELGKLLGDGPAEIAGRRFVQPLRNALASQRQR